MEIFIPKGASSYQNKKHWQFCVGSGHALLALRTDYTRQLRKVHDELGIEYVRFHGIFNDDMSTMNSLDEMLPFPGTEAFGEVNFRACGVAYDNVLSAGMKPFVELSFMPRALAENKEQAGFNIYYRPNTSMPADFEAWKEYLKSFIRFLEHRYGAKEVRTWYFEVWNEPDLGETFFTGGKSGYFELYKASAQAIKEVDANLRVGGPATSGSKWVRQFRELCEEQGVPLDFLSTHQYAGDPIAGVEDEGGPDDEVEEPAAPEGEENPQGSDASTAAARRGAQTDGENETESAFIAEKMQFISQMLARVEKKTFLSGMRALLEDKSEMTDIPADIFEKNARIVRGQAGEYPLFYTEWGSNAIFSAATNDTRKTAAYLVKTALDVADYVDGSSVWCFSDLFEEWHPFVEPFHGGFGLLNQDGIPKPSYYAMKMLAACGSQRMELGELATKGEVGYAAFRSAGEIQVLLFRQKMKNDDLAPKERVALKVELDAAPGAVTVERIDESHGNPLRVWQEEYGSRNDLNREEVEGIIEKSKVEAVCWQYTFCKGVLETEVELGINDVCCVHIPC